MYESRIADLISALRDHQPRSIDVATHYVAASDNPGPTEWAAHVGDVHMSSMDAAHAEFGRPDVMREIVRILEEGL